MTSILVVHCINGPLDCKEGRWVRRVGGVKEQACREMEDNVK